LRAVNEQDRADRPRHSADRRNVGPVPSGGLYGADSDKPGPNVHSVGYVFRLHPTVTKRDLSDVVALPRQLAPWEVIRAVLQLADDDIRAQLGVAELCGHEPCRGRDRRDKRNIGCNAPINLATVDRASFAACSLLTKSKPTATQ
jgi:hypothetical protein